MIDQHVSLIGATSLVGTCILPLLTRAGYKVTAFSRHKRPCDETDVEWLQFDQFDNSSLAQEKAEIELWVCLAPIWVLTEHLQMLEALGIRKLVTLSSTSRFTKVNSRDPEEQDIALRLANAEAHVQSWAESQGVKWIILRPTLIYGFGRDKNVAEVSRFIRKFGFFPLFGKAKGLRQPLHAQDVADACVAILGSTDIANCAYNLSGGETITFREMVTRIFKAVGRPVRLLPVPLFVFEIALKLLRFIPRYRNLNSSMAERMNRDLAFDHSDATRAFGFRPRRFSLNSQDVSE